MQKAKWLLFLVPLLFFSAQMPKKPFKGLIDSFDCLETPEDWEHYQAFEKLYQNLFQLPQSVEMIPRRFHFIWLGTQPLPKKMQLCLESWSVKHPTWELNLWSDNPRLKIPKQFQRRSVNTLSNRFADIANLADRSFILRLCLLSEEGGIALDCDVICHKAIDELIANLDFVGVCDYPRKPFTSSALNATTCFIGAKPHHPIIEKTLEGALESWQEINTAFPGDDFESYIYRSAYHTLVPYTKAIIAHAKNKDAILPAEVFGQKWAQHLELKSWTEENLSFEERVYSKLSTLGHSRSRSHRVIFLACAVPCAIMLVLGIVLAIIRRQKKLVK